MKYQPYLLGDRTHVIHETNHRYQRQSQHKPRENKTTRHEINQRSHVKNNTAPSQRDPRVRTPLVRFIYNIKPIRHPEIKQLHSQQ